MIRSREDWAGEGFHCVLGVKFQAYWEVKKKKSTSEHSGKAMEVVSSILTMAGRTHDSTSQSQIITGYLSDFTEGGREAQRTPVTSTGDTAAE